MVIYKAFQNRIRLFLRDHKEIIDFYRPKYFHEVHGVIFVVDSSDSQRLEETAAAFAEILGHEKIQVWGNS